MQRNTFGHWIGSTGKRLAIFCGLASIVLWSQIVEARDCPRELPVHSGVRSIPLPDNKLFTINAGGEIRQVLLHWDGLPGSDDSAGEPPEIANKFIARLETYLQAISAQGFRIPTGAEHPCVTGKLLRVYFYPLPTGEGLGDSASTSRFDVTFSESSANRGTIYEDTMPTLLREVFQLVQAQYRVGAMGREWLTEGTATLALDSFDVALDNRGPRPDDICSRQVLANPFKPMFRRNSKFGDGTHACQAVVFWRYLAEQLGDDRGEPGAGIGLIHELYEFLESYRGLPSWKTAASDRIHGAGDFDGDGREELLLTSATHLGLLASTEAQSRVLAVRAFGSPLDGKWSLEASDQILGIADFNADGKDEFLIRNGGFIALIGAERDGRFRVLAGMPLGSAAFADWRPSFRDQLIAIGDFDGDGAAEAMFRGRSRIGVVRLDASGQFVSPMSTSMSRLVQRLNRNPAAINVLGVGDIDGNGRDEILARDGRGIFVWGLDAEDRQKLMFDVDYGDRFGADWLLSPDDSFLGVADLDGTVNDEDDDPGLRAEIVIKSRSRLGIIGINAFSRELETKATISVGTELDDEAVYGPRTQVMAIGKLLGPIGRQIMLRDGGRLTLLEYDYRSPNTGLLRTATSLEVAQGTLAAMPVQRRQRLERGRLEGRFNVVDRSFVREVTGAMTAALSGPEASHLITRGANRLLYLKAIRGQDADGFADKRLLLENRDVDGQYQKSLIDAVDAFIRLKDSDRTFASMWHDLSLMLLVKDSVGPSMGDRFINRDEMAPGSSVDVDADNQTPPVALAFGPIEESTDADSGGSAGFLTTSFVGRAYSAQYYYVKPVDYARQVDLSYRNLTNSRWFDFPAFPVDSAPLPPRPLRPSISAVVATGDQAHSVERDLNAGYESLDKRWTLAAGQWMGIVISSDADVLAQSVGVRIARLPAAD